VFHVPESGGPQAAPGMRIGLFGGSFDPPHEGHLEIARAALRRLGLDAVWWLVTPGNPLKQNGASAPLAERVAAARRLASHPRFVVTDIEARLGTRFTVETVRRLRERYAGVRFVWIMGADNLERFDRWFGWRDIANSTPIAVFSRPGSVLKAPLSPAAQTLRAHRRPSSSARRLADETAPAWIYFARTRNPASSTAIRENGGR